MKKLAVFVAELNKVFDDKADDYVADYHKSILNLIRIEMWAMLVSFAGLFCLAVCFVYIWLPFSYPWYAIPGAVLSPIVTWRSIHVIKHANWHLAQF